MSAGGVFWLIVGLALLGFVGLVVRAMLQTPERREADIERFEVHRASRIAAKGPAGRPISQVANRGIGVLACPVCGGAQFKARRSKKARAGVTAATVTLPILGAAAFAGTRKTRVECTTCGTVYRRG